MDNENTQTTETQEVETGPVTESTTETIEVQEPDSVPVETTTETTEAVEQYTTFTAPIVCEISNDGSTYILEKGFYYYKKGYCLRDCCKDGHINIPKGFVTDGFTNFGFDWFIPRFGKGLKCAILHDYLCEGFHAGKNTRAEADSTFLEAMKETKAFNIFKIYTIYFAVRLYAKIKGFK